MGAVSDPAASGFLIAGSVVTPTIPQPHAKLDEEAAAAYREETRRHAEALAAVRPGDPDAVAEEFNRHMDRVNDILLEFARRRRR
jgi:DNA-binding FadR family transcriptional regulator